MSSVHRSAMGKPIDMAGIRSRNEKVRAIGNMSCNARGDIIDSNNQVVSQNTQRVNRVYNKTTVTPPTKPKAVQPQIVADESSVADIVPTVMPAIEVEQQEPPVVFLSDMSEDEIEYFDEFDADVPQKQASSTDSKTKKK